MKFLTMTNSGYLPLSTNLARNFLQPFMLKHQLIVECLDDASVAAIQALNLSNVTACRANPVETISGYVRNNTSNYNRLTPLKWSAVLSHLDDDVWFLDGDIGLFQDPEPFAGGDLAMQVNGHIVTPQHWGTGCFRVKNSTAAREYLQSFLAAVAGQTPGAGDDEMMFNNYLAGHPFTITPLDIDQFRTGKTLVLFQEPVLFHVNYIIGLELKIAALKRIGKWFGGGDGVLR